MSKQAGGTRKIDVVAEVLGKLRKDGKVESKKVEEAIESYNTMQRDYQKYAKFYHDNQGSYASMSKSQREAQQSQNNKEQRDHSQLGPKATNKLKEEHEQLKFENEKLKNEIKELKNRLSSITGQKMSDNNPNIADLSDPHRPTQLAERFKQIYDDEWTHAFEELETKHKHDESKIIELLADLINEIDGYCVQASKEQIEQVFVTVSDDLTNPKVSIEKGQTSAYNNRSEMDKQQQDHLKKVIGEIRKSFGTLSVRPLTQIFSQTRLQKFKEKIPASSEHINSFVAKAIGVIWLMKVQHPPMVLLWQEPNGNYDKGKFSFYTKKGDRVKQNVWPAVLLHHQGPLMSKGISQGM